MITIWDEIFKQLWLTGHHNSMQLAAALLSDKEELNNWWYADKGENSIPITHLQIYTARPRWGQLHDVLEIRAKHWESAHIYLKQAYEKWKNNSVE